MRNIRQNLFFAFVYNFLGVPIAAGVLYPWFGTAASPDYRQCRNGIELGLRHRQCAAPALGEAYDPRAIVRCPRCGERVSLFCMKFAARLLLAVALLLPFRGAVAAAGLLCHMGGSSPTTVSQAHEPGDRGHAHAATGYHQHGDEARPVPRP